MKKYLGGALASAVAATLFVTIVELIGLSQYSWIAFITWCVFFFKGASKEASVKSAPGIVYGAIIAWMVIEANTILNSGIVMAGAITFVMAFVVMISMANDWLADASVTFVGVNLVFGSGSLLWSIVFGLIGLFILAPVWVWLANKFDKVLAITPEVKIIIE